MRKREMDELMRDFMARGGKVTIIPAVNKEEETAHILPVKAQLNYDTLSLGDGEFYFGETRKRKTTKPKKKVNTEDFTKMVDASGLPSHVIEALKRSIGGNK